MTDIYHDKIIRKKDFNLLLISQGVSGFGDAFQFIAVVSLLLEISGKGIGAAFGIVAYPFASLAFSIFGGSLGDRFNSKYIMIVIDLLRAVITIIFIFSRSIPFIYFIIILFSILDTLYGPSKRKMTLNSLKRNELLDGNVILNGIQAATFIIGPITAGIIVDSFGSYTALIVKSVACLISALSISFIDSIKNESLKTKENIKFFSDIKKGFLYYKSERKIRFVVSISSILFGCITCINIVFYPFAFDVLKLTGKGWGLMMSIYYGAGFFPLLISGVLKEKIRKKIYISIYICFILLSVIWFIYGITSEIAAIFILQIIEGFVISLCTAMLSSQLLILSNGKYAARVNGINDFLNNTGKLIGIAFTFIMLQFIGLPLIFKLVAISLFCISTGKMLLSRRIILN